MNTIKKLMTAALGLLVSFSFSACGSFNKNKIDNSVEDETNLHIVALQRGYGVDFVNAWAKRFEKLNPEVKVDVKVVVDDSMMTTYFELGEDSSDYDIFFDLKANIATLGTAYDNNYFEGYDKGFLDYSYIYDSEIDGENVKFGDKINSSVKLDMQDSDQNGHYYAVPWAIGMQSIVLNKTVVEKALGSEYKIPNTTDELFAFSDRIKNAGYTAFAYPAQLDYWAPGFFCWWAQYEGLENYHNFFEGKVFDETTETYVYSANIYKQQGRLESLKILERICDLDNGYHLLNVIDYGTNNFTTLQTAFMNSSVATSKEKQYAMYPNGDWIVSESRGGQDNVIMIKMPIISSIIDNLPSVSSDVQLSAIADYVDGTITKNELDLFGSFDDEDIERVREARNIVYSQVASHIAYSPAYSNAKTLIKKFFLFAYSNEGLQIYNDNVKPGILPFEFNYSAKGNEFTKSVLDLVNNGVFISKNGRSLIAASGGVEGSSYNSGWYEAVLSVKKTSKSYRNAQQIFEAEFVSEDNFTVILRNLGLIK